MAFGDQYVAGSGKVALGAATTLISVVVQTAATKRCWVNAIRISFDGISSSAVPVDVQLVTVTNSPVVTGTQSSYLNALDAAAATAISSVKAASNASPGAWGTAPTAGVTKWQMVVPPTSGWSEWFPLGNEIGVAVSSGIGVQLNAPAVVNSYAEIVFTE